MFFADIIRVKCTQKFDIKYSDGILNFERNHRFMVSFLCQALILRTVMDHKSTAA